MKEKTKSSVLLLCLDAIILLIVTVGTTVIFRRTIGFEVDLSSDLIFFLGVFLIGKILIAALMDLTGFGQNFFVAALGIGVADALIIVINSLMHFGISTRLLIFILVFDVILIAVAHIIVGVLDRRNQKKRQKNDWLATDKQATVRDDEAMTDIYETIADGENANPALQPAASVKIPQRPYSWEPEETPEEDDNVAFTGLDGIDFHGPSTRNESGDDTSSADKSRSEQDRITPPQSFPAADNDEIKDADSEKSFDNPRIDHSDLSENVKDDEETSFAENNNNLNIAGEAQHIADNVVLESNGVIDKQSKRPIISDDTTQDSKKQHTHDVLPFDKTEALPHIETPDATEEQPKIKKPETPKTVKASYSRDTQDHLAIGPEEIVLENDNAEIIIHEDDLALIRQYMKLQRSAKD